MSFQKVLTESILNLYMQQMWILNLQTAVAKSCVRSPINIFDMIKGKELCRYKYLFIYLLITLFIYLFFAT